REALEKLLLTSLLHSKGFILPFARDPRAVASNLLKRAWHRLTAKAGALKKIEVLLYIFQSEPEDSRLRDHVLISFLSGRKPNRLGVRLPDELREVLYPEESSNQSLYLAR